MNLLQGPSALKRKRSDSNSPGSSLTEHERVLYDVIRSKENKGMWTQDMKRETKLLDSVVNKTLKSLLAKNLIKVVVNIQNKGKKFFMATEFEPAKEVTGGSFYSGGSLDIEFVKVLQRQCISIMKRKKVVTLEDIADDIKRSQIFNIELTKQEIEQIVRDLVLDNEIMEIKSNGMGEFASVPIGKVCYKCIDKDLKGELKQGGMASIPCGVCPRISLCTPDGIISPITCVYYKKWLDF